LPNSRKKTGERYLRNEEIFKAFRSRKKKRKKEKKI